jgi:hypothetical protein
VARHGERPDFRAARQTARHLVESWGIEAAEQRQRATEYRDHLVALRDELHALQRMAGVEEHDCETCRTAARSIETAAEGGTE